MAISYSEILCVFETNNVSNLFSGILISVIVFCAEIIKNRKRVDEERKIFSKDVLSKMADPENWSKALQTYNPKNLVTKEKIKRVYEDLQERAKNMYVEGQHQSRRKKMDPDNIYANHMHLYQD